MASLFSNKKFRPTVLYSGTVVYQLCLVDVVVLCVFVTPLCPPVPYEFVFMLSFQLFNSFVLLGMGLVHVKEPRHRKSSSG